LRGGAPTVPNRCPSRLVPRQRESPISTVGEQAPSTSGERQDGQKAAAAAVQARSKARCEGGRQARQGRVRRTERGARTVDQGRAHVGRGHASNAVHPETHECRIQALRWPLCEWGV
jgi:hypothetical protein